MIKTLPPVPHKYATKFLFKYIIARNIENKSSYFLDHVAEHNPDIVAITETWLTSKDAAARAECTPTGYKLLHQDRPASRRGEVLRCSSVMDLEPNAIQPTYTPLLK